MDSSLINAELLSILRLLNMTISVPSLSARDFIKWVEAYENHIQIVNSFGAVLEINTPSSVKFVSGQLKCSLEDNCKILISAQLIEKSETERLIDDMVNGGFQLSLKSSISELLLGRSLRMTCRKCDSYLTKDVSFDKVCPIPSGTRWDTGVEDWFCCAGKKHTSKFRSENNKPSETKCFYTNMMYWLNDGIFVGVEKLDDKRLCCCKCKEDLGEWNSCESLKVWIDVVNWVKVEKDVKNIIYSSDFNEHLLSLLDEAVDGEISGNCRLVFVSPGPVKKHLYMLVLDSKSTFLCSSSTDSHTIGDFLSSTSTIGNESIHIQKTNAEINDFFAGSSSTKKTVDDIKKFFMSQNISVAEGSSAKKTRTSPSTVTLKKFKAVKVLFKVVVGESQETDSWHNDNFVQFFHSSDSFLKNLESAIHLSSNDKETTLNGLSPGIIQRNPISFGL